MALETGTYISDLVATNPTSGDPKKEGDDHLRLIKDTVKNTFPNVNGAVTGTQAELNLLDGATVSTAEINILDGVTATTAEINKLDGVTATTAEINFIDGVTSDIQTQINSTNTLKADLASPTFTGVPAAPTALAGTNTTQLATTEFVIGTAFTAAVPVVAGDARKFFTNDGNTADWSTDIDVDINSFVDGTDATKKAKLGCSAISTGTTRTFNFPDGGGTLVVTSAAQALTNKTITIDDDNLTIRDNGDTTKTFNFQASGITTSTNRVLTVADNNIDLDTPGWKLLSVTTASGVTSHDIEWTNGTYDHFVILGDNMSLVSGVNDRWVIRMKIGGVYLSTSVYNSTVYAGGVGNNESSFNGSSQSTGFLSAAIIQTTSQTTRMRMYIDEPGTSLMQMVDGGMKYTSITPLPQASRFVTSCGTAGLLTGIQIRTQSGNNLSGTFKLYGVRSAI